MESTRERSILQVKRYLDSRARDVLGGNDRTSQAAGYGVVGLDFQLASNPATIPFQKAHGKGRVANFSGHGAVLQDFDLDGKILLLAPGNYDTGVAFPMPDQCLDAIGRPGNQRSQQCEE